MCNNGEYSLYLSRAFCIGFVVSERTVHKCLELKSLLEQKTCLAIHGHTFGGGVGNRTVEKGVSGVRGPGPAKVLLNEKFDCSLGPSAIKYPMARTGSRRPWLGKRVTHQSFS